LRTFDQITAITTVYIKRDFNPKLQLSQNPEGFAALFSLLSDGD
jgi:hypothetical protein